MEYGRKVRETTLGETAQMGVAEGVGVAGGFIGAGILGRQVENMVKKNITAGSSMSDKLIAVLANNVPKIATWYIIKEYGPKDPGMMTEVVTDVKKSMMGSVVYDSMLRLTNHGINPVNVSIGGIRILNDAEQRLASTQGRVQSIQVDLQKVVQENSYLRQQLNEALGRLANNVSRPAIVPVVQSQITAPAPIVHVTPIQSQTPIITPQDRRKEFGAMDEAEDRRRRYGAMPYGAMPAYDSPPHVVQRERKYGFAGDLVSNEKEIANMFGMV